MSDIQNTGLAVTGDDAVDFQAEIDAILASNLESTQQAQSNGIEVPIEGQSLKFKDTAEIGAKLQELAKNYQTILSENAALKAQTAAVNQTQPATKPKDTAKFSNEEFSKYIQEGDTGVAKALNYAMNHMFFDGNVTDAAKTISTLLQQSAATAADLTVLRFKDAHPDLPRNAETGQVLEQVRQRYGLPFTTDGLEASYAIARQHNLIQVPNQTQTSQTTGQSANPQQTAINQHFATPPMSRQSASTVMQPTPAQEQQLWDMPMDKLRQLFNKYHSGVN